MRGLKISLLSIITLGVVGGAGFLLFNGGYASGEASGFENGYHQGEESGYSRGDQEGYQRGYSTGEEEGYSMGYNTGAIVGYDSGYSEGEEQGYTEGYSKGQTAGYASGYNMGIEAGLGHGYTLKDPTYAEALSFMRTDATSENTYVEGDYGTYVCSHFSRDTDNNAEAAGYRCALVELRYRSSGHTIVAFNTIDRGLVFFEPQTDELAAPEIGKKYFQCVSPAPGTYYTIPEYDDTIMDILIIW
jgi:hypothetical protein